jgi:hypothetical protein
MDSTSVDFFPPVVRAVPKITREDLQKQACRANFVRRFSNALERAGSGSRAEHLLTLSLQEVVDRFAHNGLRLTYEDAAHMDNVGVSDELVEAANTLR